MVLRKAKYIGLVVGITGSVLLSGCSCSKDSDNSNNTQDRYEGLNFDFGINKDMTVDGWNAVTVLNNQGEGSEDTYRYTSERGYGFIGDAQIKGREETSLSTGGDQDSGDAVKLAEEVYQDYALADGAEFVVDLENGCYTVQFVVGTSAVATTSITAEGKTSDEIGEKGTYSIGTLTNIEVTDGQMNITFTGSGMLGGLINAISIVQVGTASNLQAEYDISSNDVNLSWEGSGDIAYYNVYRYDITGAETVFKNIEATNYKDSEAEEFETYRYAVTAAVATGAESEKTERVTVSLIDSTVTKCEIPDNLLVTSQTADKTVLSWDKVDGAKKYAVYWAEHSGNTTDGELIEGYTLVEKTDKTEVTFEKATAVARYYKVYAVNEGGYSKSADIKAGIGTGYTVNLEKLNRGLVAVKTDGGVYIGWRLLADEYADEMTFEVYRDGNKIANKASTDSTNLIDKDGNANSTYMVKGYKNAELSSTSPEVKPIEQQYYEIPLQKPDMIKLPDNSSYTYNANDTSVGDMNGDGIYEYYVKWEPSNSQDNSKAGYTGPVYIDCYSLDGTLNFRINLGINIRAGAHYTQFQVFDYDGDGKCELICKTSDGTIDGTGKVIGDAAADYRSENGYILKGNEYLTLFDGANGKALDTINYNPERGSVSSWGDAYGNRVDRFLAGTAYLDGEHPSAIFARGYYTRAVVAAYDVVNNKLVERWVCDSNNSENADLAGQGAHCLTTADVDSDGRDEIVYGSATIDDNGSVMYSLKSVNGAKNGGHGDAVHVGDFNLTNPGLEVFMVHEESPLDAGIEMHIGSVGRYIYSVATTSDIGRGAAADIDSDYLGCESWAAGNVMSADGEVISNSCPAANFVIWWDGDTGREILDHKFSESSGIGIPIIYKWNTTTNVSDQIFKMDGTSSNNWTKGNPCLQADLFGDWREEVVVRTTNSTSLRIYITVDETDFRMYTLMHDVQYRCAVAWQNTAYNQPPHTSFYIGFDRDYIEIPEKIIKYN